MASMIPFMRSNLSLTSQNSLQEPMICSDEFCTYPFGPACESCSLALDMREQRRQHLDSEDGSNEWIEDLNTENPNIDAAEQFFFDGTSNKSTIATKDKEEHYVINADYNLDADSDLEDSDNQSIKTVIPYRSNDDLAEIPRSPLSTCSETTSFSHSSQFSIQTSLSTSLDSWLSTLFDHTLAGQASAVVFVGGADKQDPTEDDCPLCFKPIGDPRDQHLLRCKYAHEEKGRMDWLMRRGEELKRRRE
ncbi:hypothetical protein EG329_010322 [Mollisiaceae sp. DMI_Dod_QoI]|nr:hypothetical protein EG329_010322 [Helotiales sp. DMI_Dod_QoI]